MFEFLPNTTLFKVFHISWMQNLNMCPAERLQ